MTENHLLSLRGIKYSRLFRGGQSHFELDIPCLDIREGEILGIIGPNGAGKSTLLRILGFLQKPKQGELFFRNTLAPYRERYLMRRKITLVFSEHIIYNTSVKENIALGLRFRGESNQNIKAKLHKYLEYFGLLNLAEKKATLLSNGEKRRLSLARAFIIEPDLLLLDEPFSALDEPTKTALLQDLHQTLSDKHITTVLVSQSRQEIISICHRVAVMLDGKIRQLGTTEEVFNQPISQEVADFVGMETILQGTVIDRTSIKLTSGNIIQSSSVYPEGTKVIVGIRPEEVLLMKGGVGGSSLSARNRLPGRVRRIIPLGYQYKILLDCQQSDAQSPFPITSIITKMALDELALTENSECLVLFKANAVHIISVHSC
jgi:tungstate transport system ATP-binding protein